MRALAGVGAASGGVVEHVQAVVFVLGGGGAGVVDDQVPVALGRDPVLGMTRVLQVLQGVRVLGC